MFGDTPMGKAVKLAEERFRRHLSTPSGENEPILLIVSDGMPTDTTPDAIINDIDRLKKSGLVIISCFITDNNLLNPRHLYGATKDEWPDGAKLMFECASLSKPNSSFDTHFVEHGWTKDASARLFAQVNHTELLKEFSEIVISPLRETKDDKLLRDLNNKVFISYNHKDQKWLDRFHVHLKPIVRSGTLDAWSDKILKAGDNWRAEIEHALETATMALLLTSADFMHSDFIAEVELPRLLRSAKQRDAVIIPLVISESLFFLMTQNLECIKHSTKTFRLQEFQRLNRKKFLLR